MQSPEAISAYEQQRLQQINANKEVLKSLGLLEDADALRAAAAGGSTQKTQSLSRKTKRVLRPHHKSAIRKSSGRAEKLEKLQAHERAQEAQRKAQEEAEAEERREVQRRARKERERIARREAVIEAKRRAKLEEERKARQRALAEERRQRDAEMRLLRQDRAEARRRERAEERRQRDEEMAAAAETIRERKLALRGVADSSIEAAVLGAEQRRRVSERAAQQRSREARLDSNADYFTVREGMCAAPGCELEMHHLGPCSHEVVSDGARRQRQRVSYAEESDAEFIRKYALNAAYDPSAEREEREERRRQHEKTAPLKTTSMLAKGHPYLGRRVARLFGKRLVLGTVTGWIPACRVEGVGALFRVVHDDADEEDLEEEEVAEAGEDYTQLAPREDRWLKCGHPHLGLRLSRSFSGGGRAMATVTRWLPPDLSNGDPALFRLSHEDGDVEELEPEELEEALRAHRSGSSATPASSGSGSGSGGVGDSLATITRWLPAELEAEEPELFHCVHDDGDEEDLERYEVLAATKLFERKARAKADWKVDGHPLLGREVLRTTGRSKYDRDTATLSGWMPACAASGQTALFRVTMGDGREEEMEEADARAAAAAFDAMPPRRGCARVSGVKINYADYPAR